ncbi:MAG: hypothetical protein FWD67_03555 [Betaproteobacteria bacterium]|nr:hypothetical protein [Betaproteobacteria bacterium]
MHIYYPGGEKELSPTGNVIVSSIVVLVALIFIVFNILIVWSNREDSVTVPAEIVKDYGYRKVDLKFVRLDGREVKETTWGVFYRHNEGEQVTVRLSRTDANAPAKVDNFLNNWWPALIAGWQVLGFGFIGIFNLKKLLRSSKLGVKK